MESGEGSFIVKKNPMEMNTKLKKTVYLRNIKLQSFLVTVNC